MTELPLINRIAGWTAGLQSGGMDSHDEQIEITDLVQWDRMVQSIVDCAMRTPYFHLPGYMDRYWFLPEIFGKHASRVHRILRSDVDRHLHDHPWPYVSVVLLGGYMEVTPVDEGRGEISKWYGPGSVLYRRAHSRHRLILPRNSETVSLFMMGKREHEWGFHTEAGKVSWKDYLDADDVAEQRAQHAKFDIGE